MVCIGSVSIVVSPPVMFLTPPTTTTSPPSTARRTVIRLFPTTALASLIHITPAQVLLMRLRICMMMEFYMICAKQMVWIIIWGTKHLRYIYSFLQSRSTVIIGFFLVVLVRFLHIHPHLFPSFVIVPPCPAVFFLIFQFSLIMMRLLAGGLILLVLVIFCARIHRCISNQMGVCRFRMLVIYLHPVLLVLLPYPFIL